MRRSTHQAFRRGHQLRHSGPLRHRGNQSSTDPHAVRSLTALTDLLPLDSLRHHSADEKAMFICEIPITPMRCEA